MRPRYAGSTTLSYPPIRDQPYHITLLRSHTQGFTIASCFTAYCRAAQSRVRSGDNSWQLQWGVLQLNFNWILILGQELHRRIGLTPKMLINKVAYTRIVLYPIFNCVTPESVLLTPNLFCLLSLLLGEIGIRESVTPWQWWFDIMRYAHRMIAYFKCKVSGNRFQEWP